MSNILKSFKNVNIDVHFQDPLTEDLTMIIVPTNTTKSITDITLDKGFVKAKINCNYFNNTNSRNYGQSYGVRQGVASDGNLVDEKPEQKEWFVVSVAKDNSITVVNSTEYWTQAKDIKCAFSPALVVLHDGRDVNIVSTGADGKTMDTLTSQSFFMKTEDGRLAIGVTQGNLKARDLREWAKQCKAVHLSLLDSGGSCQMIENGEKIKYTGRKIKDVLAFYKKEIKAEEDDEPLSPDKELEIGLYPCPLVHITQNSLTSDKGTHMNTYAIDLVGNIKYSRLYAPFTMKVASINKNSKSSEVIFHSCDRDGLAKKVRIYNNDTSAYFEDYMTIRMVHKNDIELFSIGKVFKQGDWCYNTGTRGLRGVNSVPDHAHVELARGYTTDVTLTDNRPSVLGQNLIGAIRIEKFLVLKRGYHVIYSDNGARGNNFLYVDDLEHKECENCKILQEKLEKIKEIVL